MALTIPRCVAIVLAGWLLAMAVVLKPAEDLRNPELSERQSLATRDFLASRAAHTAARRLHTMQVVDSVAAVLARVRRTDSSLAVYGPGLTWREDAVKALVRRTTPLRPTTRISPVDLAFVLDTASLVRGWSPDWEWWRVTRVLPAAPADRCVNVMRFNRVGSWSGSDKWWRARLAELGGQELMGPCAFYEAFGTPGPEINEWLRSGAWKFGMASTGPRPFGERPAPPQPMAEFWQSKPDPVRRHVSTLGYQCLTGDHTSCRELMLAPRGRAFDSYGARTVGGNILETSEDLGPEGYLRYQYDGDLRYRNDQAWIFSDMIRTLGPQRFRAFWSSNLAPAEAFRAAAGQDMGAWTSAWARDVYGDRVSGPGVDPASAVFATMIILLAIGSAVISARSQQVA